MDSYIDYTGGLNLRNATTSSGNPTITFNINKTTNQGTFNYNLNTTGITNSTNALTNNGVLTQNSTANINSDINVSGLPFFSAPSTLLFPTSTSYSSKSGFEIFWNIKSGQGDTVFLNHSAGGSGGFNWWNVGTLHNRINLMYLDDSKNLSLLNNISCASVTATGAISCSTVNATGAINMTSLTSETINKSKFLSFKGYSNYNNTEFIGYHYYFTKYDGTTSTYGSAPIVVDSNCFHIRLTYTYNTLNSSSQNIKGCTEYVFIKSNSTNLFEQYSPWSVGTNSYQPEFNLTNTNQITILWAINTDQLISNQSYLYWNFAVFVN